MLRRIWPMAALAAVCLGAVPEPPGKLVDLGGHRLHVYCTGSGAPTVVVENGLGDYSFDWALVQARVSRFTRICTYDRAGYAWSDSGPKPRSFGQINFDLHEALAKLGEHGPFVMVGHSYGGPLVRNFTAVYRDDVAGMVQVDAAFEGERVGIGGGKTIRLGEGAKGVGIPAPHEQMGDSDKPALPTDPLPDELKKLDAMFAPLPAQEQAMQLWAQQQLAVYDAQNGETQWSEETFAKWLAASQAGSLGSIPLVVLSRANGGYSDADVPAVQLERERKAGQAMLVKLSTNSRQIVIDSGHNMNLEAPDAVAAAIREVVDAVRKHHPLN